MISLTTLGAWSVFAAINLFYNSSDEWYPLLDGYFYTDGTGNAGVVDLQNAGRNGDTGKLTGKAIFQSIGSKNEFDNVVLHLPKDANGNNKNPTRACWTLSGVIKTQNAGNILLSDAEWARVRYNPVSQHLEWYGYNKNLGKVWLGMDEFCGVDEEIDEGEVELIKQNNKRANQAASFIGRVKVIGNIGANDTIFGEIYEQEIWIQYAEFSRVIGKIRENIFLRSRNISTDLKNENFVLSSAKNLGDTIFFVNNSENLKTVKISSIPDNIRSIVIIGGDAVIEKDITNSPAPRVVIAVQNENNRGGNIYIKENVKNLELSFIAEKAILSGNGNNDLYNDIPDEIVKLPKNQLYIKWLFASRNTIGGASSALNDIKCPYLPENSNTCDKATAQIFDLNYFRNFDHRNDGTRAYMDNSLDEYSLIIEYDKNLISNPPSILSNFK